LSDVFDVTRYLEQERIRNLTPINAALYARVFAYKHRLAWDLVAPLEQLLRGLSSAVRPHFETANWDEGIEDGPFPALFSRCESPIEEMFLAALIRSLCATDRFSGADWDVDGAMRLKGGPSLTVTPQAPVLDGKRADFLLSTPTMRLVCELDGHDFHERTKEQATRDKARDRALTSAGYTVMRFTGSEVWRDPEPGAQQALEFVLRGTP
jgi:very-short-patch-repair endonuclease